MREYPRVLIVGTVPYNKKSTSRAFESYFHGWDRDCLAQVFSNTRTPAKGHCEKLYQITDQRLVKRRFRKKLDVGKRFTYDVLPDEWLDDDLELGSSLYSKLYAFGSRSTHITHLIRKIVWAEKYWCTRDFNEWLDEFNPECVFLSFSNDFFILEIALYAARRFNIPIVSSIGDDYYFEEKSTYSPLYWLYKVKYRKLVDSIFAHGGSAIYIGDKIRDKYNYEFGLNGKTVFLTSEAERRPFRAIDKKEPIIRYFGNIRLGRNSSLCVVADVLASINSNYRVEVYSNEVDSKYYRCLEENPNIDYMGSVPYKTVLAKTMESDVLLVVEGFEKEYVDITRYSLSTKVADALASGVAVIGFGDPECGAIEYMQQIGCCCVATNPKELKDRVRNLFDCKSIQISNYEKSAEVVLNNHTLEKSNAVFLSVVNSAIERFNK